MSEDIIKIFYSYSRKDLDMRNTLEDHLSALREAGRISTWHDLELEAGTEWEPAILNKLDTADIILLLVSRNFIASKYCYGTELKRAIARHNEGIARVIPIILRPCDWNHSDVPFSRLNVLPTHAKPITSWTDQDEAFTIVAQRIRETVDQLRVKKQIERQSTEQQKQQLVTRKNLQQCNPAKILFIKNVKDPSGWAYLLERMEQPESRAFELWWRQGSYGVSQPKAEDLMILHQRARVTHIVEFLDDQVRQTNTGSFRWVRAVWIAEHDWSQLPHQETVLGFSPKYADGNTHSLNSTGFSTFRETWSSLEEFQKHIFRRLTQTEAIISDEDELASEKGVGYSELQDLLRKGQSQDLSSTVIQLCKEACPNELIHLIHWEVRKKQQLIALFRECRRGWYFQLILSPNKEGKWSRIHKVCPIFLPLLEPDENLWKKLTRAASPEDWYVVDDIIRLGFKFQGSEIRLAGKYLIGEEVADEALEQFGVYVPDADMLPALLFINKRLGLRLLSYLKHPNGFAKENLLCDDNTNDCEVFDSLQKAQQKLEEKLNAQVE